MRGVAAGVVLQLALGAPFLLAYPASYVSRAFEFTRVSEGHRGYLPGCHCSCLCCAHLLRPLPAPAKLALCMCLPPPEAQLLCLSLSQQVGFYLSLKVGQIEEG